MCRALSGHISNTVVPVWFEAGRAEVYDLFRGDDPSGGTPLVIKTFTVTFHRELDLLGEVTIECGVLRVGRTSFALVERALQNGRLCASGEVVYVVLGPAGPVEVPPSVRKQLEAHRVVSEAGDTAAS